MVRVLFGGGSARIFYLWLCCILRLLVRRAALEHDSKVCQVSPSKKVSGELARANKDPHSTNLHRISFHENGNPKTQS